MGLVSRLSDLLGVSRKNASSDDVAWTGGWTSMSASGIQVGQLSAMQASAVQACVTTLSEDVAKLPLHIYRPTPDGGRNVAQGHTVEKLLAEPNDWQTRFEFIEMLMSGLLMRGNAYAVAIRDRGTVTSLVPVNPDRVAQFEAPDGSLFYRVSRNGFHETAVLQSKPFNIPSEDVLHLRWLSMDGLRGLSRIGLARESIGLMLAQEQHAARMAGNGARPGGALTTDKKLSDDTRERLKAAWQAEQSGLANAGKTALLEEGLKWQPLAMTSLDAEFLASREFQVAEIGRLFRMPLHKLGIMERTTGTTLTQLDQDYLNNTVVPYLDRIESKVIRFFGLEKEGLIAEFDVTRFLRADMQTRYNAYRTGVIGIFLTPNEVRRAEGLPAVPDGDKLLQPVNMVPIGTLPAPGTQPGADGSDMTGEPAAGGDGDPTQPEPVESGDPPPIPGGASPAG